MQIRAFLSLISSSRLCRHSGAGSRRQFAGRRLFAGHQDPKRALVLVDAVVTDKKEQYVRDLQAKDFKVWEDNKEQAITSFSFEADPNSPNNTQKHYMVLLFDNATMEFGRSDARAAGRYAVHRRQRRSQPFDGHYEFRRQYHGNARFHGRRGSFEEGGGRRQVLAGFAQPAGGSGFHGHTEFGQGGGRHGGVGRVACRAQPGQDFWAPYPAAKWL